eukprot:TRINITY_DN152_c0_g2_i2.p1 TRINITY_DN152_c0_g2~~TRINITY_DN152_c0_g2_i2.p1  ORF type:complete len:161 (-),score=25.62 TRINITY_DN152_c0_g2_i2:279-761(-)
MDSGGGELYWSNNYHNTHFSHPPMIQTGMVPENSSFLQSSWQSRSISQPSRIGEDLLSVLSTASGIKDTPLERPHYTDKSTFSKNTRTNNVEKQSYDNGEHEEIIESKSKRRNTRKPSVKRNHEANQQKDEAECDGSSNSGDHDSDSGHQQKKRKRFGIL